MVRMSIDTPLVSLVTRLIPYSGYSGERFLIGLPLTEEIEGGPCYHLHHC